MAKDIKPQTLRFRKIAMTRPGQYSLSKLNPDPVDKPLTFAMWGSAFVLDVDVGSETRPMIAYGDYDGWLVKADGVQ